MSPSTETPRIIHLATGNGFHPVCGAKPETGNSLTVVKDRDWATCEECKR